ncbi:MAG TPA: hypothetical protein VH724_15030, partial [Candidatus Angelobacter sp.]|nr:hypothetical protein [Candidatus Angelobacter sp.]
MMSATHTSHSFSRRSLAILVFSLMVAAAGAAQSPPTIVKSFSSANVGLNLSTTLTFTITNPNPATDLTGVGFNDNMPAGLIIANPDSLTGTCDPGVITTAPNNINLVGATVLANSSCTFSIDVLAVATGTQVNTTDPVTSIEGGTGGTATASVVVVTPDLTITSTHTGNFTRPQTGATYTLTVTNSGPVDTTALITVRDTLPAGLTATAIDGLNWICTLSPLGCTRGDTLLAGTSFEPITVTVNVSNSAASSVTNTATVSGGGETNTANDTATDPTQIDAVLQMAAQTANLTVAAGSTASSVLNVTYNGGLGAITFACSGLPAATTCGFNPPSVSATGATPVTLTITTTARSTAVPVPPSGIPPQFTLLLLMGLAGVLFATRIKNPRMRL